MKYYVNCLFKNTPKSEKKSWSIDKFSKEFDCFLICSDLDGSYRSMFWVFYKKKEAEMFQRKIKSLYKRVDFFIIKRTKTELACDLLRDVTNIFED